ncbi:retrovirus-related Pol polyprotein from type-2 retrotransposable element R2DM [Trichonephila clavipes]|nr:retrovirus-related Pol polyprotein from type-2 retrotransposable element R2DM [Trichonephila clavipes]
MARGALNLNDSTLYYTPPVVSRLLIISPATSPTQEVRSLLFLCTRFINRGLAQSQKSNQSPSPVAHREISASQNAPMTVIAPQMKPFSQDSTPALPVQNLPLSDDQLTPLPPVLHPLASGVSGESVVSTASIRCLYCEDLFRTQKGLNSHLVSVHRPISVVPTASTFDPVLNEDDPPVLKGDTTFVISGSPEPKLNKFQKEWIARFNDPSAKSLDALGALALSVKSPVTTLFRHFSNIFSSRAIPDDFPFLTYPEPVADDFLAAPFVASEKGFRENEGCVEHNFLLEQAIVEAKRSRSDLALAWLDLENAFSSIPHAFIIGSLKAVGVPVSVINIISSLYSNAKSEIRCGPDWSSPIPMEAGVRQGCPLSAILFNLSLEQILRPSLEVDSEGYSLFGKSLRCLAYADDLVIIDKSKNSLQKLLDSLCSTSSSIGLRFNPPNCASLAFYHSRGRRSVDTTDLKILNTPIPSLSGLEAYKYLGLKVGLNFHHDYSCLFRLCLQ